MPSERFYRLSEEKRKTICEAAIREFARVTMDKVSINQIIKNADISRGSFYTYFEDKWDIVSYIFEDIQEKLIILVKDRARKTGGDIFAVMDCIMQEILQFCCSRPNFDFLKNIMLHMNSDDMFGGRLSKKKNEEYAKTGEQVERWLYEHADQARRILRNSRIFTACLRWEWHRWRWPSEKSTMEYPWRMPGEITAREWRFSSTEA